MEIILVLVGVLVGTLAGFFGIGGGMILIPILMFLGIDIKTAIGISIVQMVFASVYGSYLNHKRGSLIVGEGIWVGVGGLNPQNYVETHVDFTGVNFVQSWGYYTWILRAKLQYEVIKNVYVIARADAGINTMELYQLTDFDKTMFGYGLTASYNSYIGPIELTMMGSNINSGVSFFVNVGFWL